MKVLALVLVLAFNVLADTNISNFTGKIYLKEDLNSCLSDYDSIQKNMNKVDGFTILDGGCLDYGQKHTRLEFNYMHPLAKRIDTFKSELRDEATCESKLQQAQNEIIASGNIYINAFCSRHELKLNFVDITYSTVNTLRNLGRLNAKSTCENLIADLNKNAKAVNAFSLLSYCKEVSYGIAAVTYYIPVFNYVSFYEIDIELIKGKSSMAQGSCLNNAQRIAANFANNDVKIIHTYCSDNSADSTQQENILYLKPKLPKYITEFKGVVLNDANTCEVQLENIVSALENSGSGVLYSQCMKIGEKRYRANVNYVKVLDI